MNKRIAIAFGLSAAAAIFLSSGVWIGERVGKRGPGQDWDIQQGLYEPTGGAAESARRGVLGSLASTGHILWASSFNENIAEVDNISVGVGSKIEWSDLKANSGPGSVKFTSGTIAGNYAGLRRMFSQYSILRSGVFFSVYPVIDSTGSSLSDLVINMVFNYYGSNDPKFVSAKIKISRVANGATKLYYEDVNGSWVDTTFNIGAFFVNINDNFPWTWWRTLRLVVDPSLPVPKYSYFELDGLRYDLSGFTPYYLTPSMGGWNMIEQRGYIFSEVDLATQETIAKTMFFDDMGITDDEP